MLNKYLLETHVTLRDEVNANDRRTYMLIKSLKCANMLHGMQWGKDHRDRGRTPFLHKKLTIYRQHALMGEDSSPYLLDDLRPRVQKANHTPFHLHLILVTQGRSQSCLLGKERGLWLPGYNSKPYSGDRRRSKLGFPDRAKMPFAEALLSYSLEFCN